jgi:hypothetical protein
MYKSKETVLYLDYDSGYMITQLPKVVKLCKKNVNFTVFKFKNRTKSRRDRI